MNKTELVQEVKERINLPIDTSKELVEMVLEIITDSLATGEDVSLLGFGSFVVKEKKAYIGRNPHTGEDLPIDAKTGLVFKPGARLKEAIRKGGDRRRNPPKRRRTH